MIKIALLFPGQGAQKVGMGKDFYERSPEARAIFDQADQILGNGLTDVIFSGPLEKLMSTAYCQPAIFTMSMAVLKVFSIHPIYQKIIPQFAAGLSLGEYSALAAGQALSFADALQLVSRRSSLMEEATRAQAGKMAAIIGLDKNKIVEICHKTGAEIANYNSPQQIVITGHAKKVEEACLLCKSSGAKSVIPLDVSGAFHSSLMAAAAEKFEKDLKNIPIQISIIPIVSNVNGKSAQNPDEIRNNLARQITSSVQWVDSILHIAGQGVKNFLEIGPGTVLKGLIRRIDPSLNVQNIETVEDLAALKF